MLPELDAAFVVTPDWLFAGMGDTEGAALAAVGEARGRDTAEAPGLAAGGEGHATAGVTDPGRRGESQAGADRARTASLGSAYSGGSIGGTAGEPSHLSTDGGESAGPGAGAIVGTQRTDLFSDQELCDRLQVMKGSDRRRVTGVTIGRRAAAEGGRGRGRGAGGGDCDADAGYDDDEEGE